MGKRLSVMTVPAKGGGAPWQPSRRSALRSLVAARPASRFAACHAFTWFPRPCLTGYAGYFSTTARIKDKRSPLEAALANVGRCASPSRPRASYYRRLSAAVAHAHATAHTRKPFAGASCCSACAATAMSPLLLCTAGASLPMCLQLTRYMCPAAPPPAPLLRSLETLELLEKVTKNSAVQPAEEKFRRLKLRCAHSVGRQCD